MGAKLVTLLTGWWVLWTQKSSSVYSGGPLVGFSVPPIGHNEMIKTTAQIHNECGIPFMAIDHREMDFSYTDQFLDNSLSLTELIASHEKVDQESTSAHLIILKVEKTHPFK